MSGQNTEPSQVLFDIARGYSFLDINSQKFYFKHPSNLNYLESEEYYHSRLQQAVKKGISTEAQLLARCIKRGVWSKKQEEKIVSLKWTIEKSNAAAQKIVDQNQKKVFLGSLEKQKEELADLEKKRGNLVNQSAENWASQQRMLKMVEDHVFFDKEMTKPVDNLNNITVILKLQERIAELSDYRSLLKAAFEPAFFDIYAIQYRNPLDIFKVDFFSITVFQRLLFSYASVLLNKLKNLDMPDDVRKNPILIYEFNQASANSSSKVSHGVDDLKNSMRKKGKITAEDLVQ